MPHSKATVDLLRTAQDALARSGGLLCGAPLRCAVLCRAAVWQTLWSRAGCFSTLHASAGSTAQWNARRIKPRSLPVYSAYRAAGRQDAAALHAAAGARAA